MNIITRLRNASFKDYATPNGNERYFYIDCLKALAVEFQNAGLSWKLKKLFVLLIKAKVHCVCGNEKLKVTLSVCKLPPFSERFSTLQDLVQKMPTALVKQKSCKTKLY